MRPRRDGRRRRSVHLGADDVALVAVGALRNLTHAHPASHLASDLGAIVEKLNLLRARPEDLGRFLPHSLCHQLSARECGAGAHVSSHEHLGGVRAVAHVAHASEQREATVAIHPDSCAAGIGHDAKEAASVGRHAARAAIEVAPVPCPRFPYLSQGLLPAKEVTAPADAIGGAHVSDGLAEKVDGIGLVHVLEVEVAGVDAKASGCLVDLRRHHVEELRRAKASHGTGAASVGIGRICPIAQVGGSEELEELATRRPCHRHASAGLVAA